jgi:putative hemolysin
MNFKEYVRDHSSEFRHSYIYDAYGKVGVVVVTNNGDAGWSICNKKDNFCKAKGKMIAFKRATSGKGNSLCNIPVEYRSQIREKVSYLSLGN